MKKINENHPGFVNLLKIITSAIEKSIYEHIKEKIDPIIMIIIFSYQE